MELSNHETHGKGYKEKMRLRPFFSFYGAKWRLAPKYPTPVFDTIIEPFAGSAQYSLFHCEKKVVLNDIDPIICSVWDYLISVSEKEILDLPDDITDVNSHCLNQEQKYLVGFWLNQASATPRQRVSSWHINNPEHASFWRKSIKERIAGQLKFIRHWRIINKSFDKINEGIGTYFIDPPYQDKGKFYRFGSKNIDYQNLGSWVRGLDGQVIVAEDDGADWLDFKPFHENMNFKAKKKMEMIWTNDPA